MSSPPTERRAKPSSGSFTAVALTVDNGLGRVRSAADPPGASLCFLRGLDSALSSLVGRVHFV